VDLSQKQLEIEQKEREHRYKIKEKMIRKKERS